MRDAVEDPLALAGLHVPRGHVARRRRVARALRGQRKNHEILEHAARIARDERAHVRDVEAVACERAAEIAFALAAEGLTRLARAGVEGGEEAAALIEQGAIRAVLARPVVHAARA